MTLSIPILEMTIVACEFYRDNAIELANNALNNDSKNEEWQSVVDTYDDMIKSYKARLSFLKQQLLLQY